MKSIKARVQQIVVDQQAGKPVSVRAEVWLYPDERDLNSLQALINSPVELLVLENVLEGTVGATPRRIAEVNRLWSSQRRTSP